MSELSTLRLTLLRGMYLLMAAGLFIVIWPSILAPASPVADVHTVVRALLGALSLLFLLGVRYPIAMLPIMFFELLWKVVWSIAFALPMWLGPGLDAFAAATLIEVAVGLVLVPLVLPWGYLVRHYVRAPATPWRVSAPALAMK